MKFTTETSFRNTGADFETYENLCEKSKVVRSSDRRVDSCGMVMDFVNPEIFVTSPRETHVLLVGGTGSGKTRRVMVPSIIMQGKTGTSMVITDPKGELYRFTAKDLKAMGYEILSVNMRNPSRGNRWNPLSYIEKYYNSEDVELRDKASVMLSDIANILKKGIHSIRDLFWENSAAGLFMGVAQMILEKGLEGGLTFENIFNVARMMLIELSSKDLDSSNLSQSLWDYYNGLDEFNPIKRNLSPLFTGSIDRMQESILATFETMLNPYVSQEAFVDLTCKSEMDFEDIGRRPTALFLILPDDSAALYPLASIMIKQIYNILVRQADENIDNGGKLENPVFFMLDEFGTICGSPSSSVIPDFPLMMSAGRSRGFRFAIVCQSIEQLSVNYKVHEANTIVGNCDTWLYLNSRDMSFIQRLQEQIGVYVSPNTGRERPLISTIELQKMELGRLLVLNKCCSPYWGHLKDFTEYDFGPEISMEEVALPESREAVKRIHTSLEDLLSNKEEERNEWEPEDFDSDYLSDDFEDVDDEEDMNDTPF